jgi:hypothetical protein
MAFANLPSNNSDAGIRSLDCTSHRSMAPLVTHARHDIAIALVGLALAANVAWIGALGWATGVLFRFW